MLDSEEASVHGDRYTSAFLLRLTSLKHQRETDDNVLTLMTSMNSSGSVDCNRFNPTTPALAKKKSRRPFSETARWQTAEMADSSAASASMWVT